ncbi:MAG: hypothetical protein QM522_03800 [Chitinophagaceae bacterium]|jgi:hypothetical protein|nr:hypothetical protein [Chitinophagaceae bacterium]
MARFLLVLKPNGSAAGQAPAQRPEAILAALEPVLQALNAEVDHRTPAHLGALLKQGAEIQRMQLFADVQARADGRALELVLLSREAMGLRAPQTLEMFERLVALIEQHMPEMTVIFRSDRDGPLP